MEAPVAQTECTRPAGEVSLRGGRLHQVGISDHHDQPTRRVHQAEDGAEPAAQLGQSSADRAARTVHSHQLGEVAQQPAGPRTCRRQVSRQSNLETWFVRSSLLFDRPYNQLQVSTFLFTCAEYQPVLAMIMSVPDLGYRSLLVFFFADISEKKAKPATWTFLAFLKICLPDFLKSEDLYHLGFEESAIAWGVQYS